MSHGSDAADAGAAPPAASVPRAAAAAAARSSNDFLARRSGELKVIIEPVAVNADGLRS